MPDSLRLTFVSHACVRIDGPFGALLCDPWILNEPVYNFTTWKYPVANMAPEEVLDGVTHVYISHTHEDHFHVPSLNHIPRDVTLLLPEFSWNPGLRAQTMERTMRRMGFYNIHKPKPWEEYALDQDTNITFVPAAESKPQDWENSAIVIDHPDVRILNVNDCPSDVPLYETLAEKFDHFDVALLQYAGVSMYPGRFRMTEDQMREAVRSKRASFVEQKRAVDMLNIDAIIPFAGDFCWLDDDLFHCNWACRATPHLFQAWHDETYPDDDREILIMYPSDTWSKSGGVVRNHPEIDWSNYLEDLKAVQARFRTKIDAINAWYSESSTVNLKARTESYLANMERFITREPVSISASIRFEIEGASEDLAFEFRISPHNGFSAAMGRHGETDHICHLSVVQWASVLESKLMINTLHWTSEILQREPYNPDVGKFWWWLESNGDLYNRGPQVLMEDRQFPTIGLRNDPQFGVFPG